MKKETMYKKSVMNIGRGFAQLGVSVWHSVYNHPACTALIVSVVLNVCLFVSAACARVERDKSCATALHYEMEADSMAILVNNQ